MRIYLYVYSVFVALLLLEQQQVRGDDSEYGSCDSPEETLPWANSTAALNKCGCTVQPTCTECVKSSLLTEETECTNGCEYCDPTQTTCGQMKFRYERSVQSTFVGSIFVTDIIDRYRLEWTYTRGKTGSVVYRVYQLSAYSDQECYVYVNDQECASCYLQNCEDESLLPEPVIDCTNVEAGATAGSADVICTARNAGGFVSLDDSALNGVLSPLAIPFLGCQDGTAVLASAPSPGLSTMDSSSGNNSAFDGAESQPPSDPQATGNGTVDDAVPEPSNATVDDSLPEPRSESKARPTVPLCLGMRHENIQCMLVASLAAVLLIEGLLQL